MGKVLSVWRSLPLALAGLLVLAGSAAASCFPLASAPGPRIMPANLAPAPAAKGTVDLTFIGHSSFLIQTAEGVSAITDYNDYNKPRFVPDIVTMNRAHSTHYTENLDPGIRHVLRGWSPDGGMARHGLTYKDLKVRNVPTNIRGYGGTEMNGNSIFVFESADLCIAHFSHLHHLLTQIHIEEMGPIDVALVQVDGNYSIAQEDIVEVLRQTRAPIVIPMHYFNDFTLQRFLALAKQHYAVRFSETPRITLSRANLPAKPEVLVLPGR